jgi:hypothetical protein
MLLLQPVVPSAVTAQETGQPDAVPEELLLTLLDDAGGRILVGRAPAWFPDDLILPADARVLGARVRDTTYAEVVVATAQSPEEVVRQYERTMYQREWKSESLMARMAEGFRSRQRATSAGFCKGKEAFLTLSTQTAGPETRLSLSYDTDLPDDHRCNAEVRSRSHKVPVPTLETPGDAIAVEMAGWAGSGKGVQLHATAESGLSAPELAARYGPQLRAQGWTLEEKQTSGGLAAWSWRLTDESGDRWHGLFMAIPLPDSTERRHALRFEIWKRDVSK